MAHEPLRVSLEDLHSAESKGKWWLVGAAWGGDPLVDRQEAPGQTGAPATAADAHDVSNNVLLKLARKQGMNTDIRRSIFVVLMSSDVSRSRLFSHRLLMYRGCRITWMRVRGCRSSILLRCSRGRS